ncbi:MAG: tRNA-dihydrouridine synthase, partial [Vicinamibacterales bacterium]
AAAVAVHGRTAAQSYSGSSDWDLIARVASGLSIPVLGSGDCLEPSQMVERMQHGVAGVLVGRGALRNPFIFEQAQALAAGRPVRAITHEERGRFLLEYIELLQNERLHESPGFRHVAPGIGARPAPSERSGSGEPRGHDKWVINKLRALNSWYTKGIDNGSHLRVSINAAQSIPHLRAIIEEFFLAPAAV